MKTVTLEEAQKMLKACSGLKEKEEIPILECVDRILAEDIFAQINQPPYCRSSMDGYAVRSIDTRGASMEQPIRFQVSDRVYAGTNELKRLKEKEAIRIMTGGMLPEGADCVVKQEDTDYGDEIVTIYKEMNPGDYFCPIGHEFSKGTLIAKAGSKVDANTIGAAVAAGLSSLPVRKKVRAAVLTTGDELCELGCERKRGQIYPSNMAYLSIRLKQLGCDVVFVRQPKDQLQVIVDSLQEAVEKADVIITTGGVSVGTKDYLEEAVTRVGAEILFHGLAVNPGRPSMVSVYGQKPILSLTGSSCSAETVFELLIRTILSAMQGTEQLELTHVSAVVQDEFPRSVKSSRQFIRGYFFDGKVYRVNKTWRTRNFSSIGTNCLLDIPEEMKKVKAGDQVCVYLL